MKHLKKKLKRHAKYAENEIGDKAMAKDIREAVECINTLKRKYAREESYTRQLENKLDDIQDILEGKGPVL